MSRRNELPRPDPSNHWVGDEHPLRGARQANVLMDWGLGPSTDLLEIGCGNGRLAYELADRITEGSYVGCDIGRDAIDWLVANYQPVLDNFRFHHLDVANARWGSGGEERAESLRFDLPDASFDMVCVFDVFMHLSRGGVENYLREIRRMLRPGGRCVMTWVVILDGEDRPVRAGKAYEPIGGGVHSRYPKRQDYALAFDRSLAARMIADAGLVEVEFYEGRWHGPDVPIRGRGLNADLFVADAPA